MRINIPERNYQITDSTPDQVMREFKGISKLDQFTIQDQYATRIKNLSSHKYPSLIVRDGYSVLGASIGSKVLGLGVWKGWELHAVFNDGTWRKWDGSQWVTLANGLNTTAEWSFCNIKGNQSDINLIGANGVDPIKRYNGSTVSDLPNAPAKGNYIDQHDNRLYCAVGNEVHFSALSEVDRWTKIEGNDTDPGQIVRETNDGEVIVGLKAGAGHITAFFSNSSHELYGTSPSDFQFVEVAADIGALNDKCIVNLGGVVYFMARSGIYVYSGGARPNKDFSAPVQWYVDDFDSFDLSKCCMGTDGKLLYVVLPIENVTEILVYDPLTGIWSVWEDIIPTHFARIGDTLYVGDNQGRVLQLGTSTDNGTAVNWEWISKPFTGPSMSQKVRWTRLWITVDKPVGSSINVYGSKTLDDTGWTLLGSMITANGLQNARIPISPAALGICDYVRLKLSGTGPAIIREISRDEIAMPIT